jgi:hypothetical protein
MDPWESSVGATSGPTGRTDEHNLHQLLTTRTEPPLPHNSRRVCPAVPFMTVKAERKCLSEIRTRCATAGENFVLSNGMYAEDFALMYVLGHQLKRKEKQSTT